ncbi:MAG: nucleotide sugar dehydrogenase [Candidatus Moraniibacteriota bacterium]
MSNNKNTTVTIIGIGYVGLPLACLVARKGYKTFGLDLNEKAVKLVNQKEVPFKDDFVSKLLPKVKLQATTDPKVLKETDIAIICVPTPVNEKNLPVFKPLKGAIESIVKNFNKGILVVVESTINPGVCEEIVLPMFEEEGYKVGKDFFLAHCPERINPGDPKWNVSNLPRCAGGVTKKCLDKTVKFYRSVIDAPITPMKSVKEAEATKTIENAFRDINIAFVNELAKSFDKMGIDLIDVIKGASSKFSFMPHWPSCGVGGHCIPVDPYYLIEKARNVGFEHDFLKLARRINSSMPHYTVKTLAKELNEIKKAVNGTKIGILGVSYKANVDDTRDAPYFHIKKELLERKAKVEVFDPYVERENTVKSLKDLLKKSEVLLLVTNHKEFEKVTPKLCKKYGIKVIIDGRSFYGSAVSDKEGFLKAGIRYKGIGR